MPGHAKISVGRDITLNGAANMTVFAGPVDDEFTFATGCSFVKAGGVISLNDTSVLSLASEALTGGSVRIDARRFVLAAGAKVDAALRGYMWLGASTPPNAPGIGYSYNVGASHGGVGGGNTKPPYDSAIAPVMPGSPNGSYANGQRPGGGVIRIHANSMEINGVLDAKAFQDTVYGGAAGGSIWLTANRFAFGSAAKLIANGGKSNYGSKGAGGRISICQNLVSETIEALAGGREDIVCASNIKDEEEFRSLLGNDTMEINVLYGAPSSADAVKGNGTFVYYRGTRGTRLLLR